MNEKGDISGLPNMRETAVARLLGVTRTTIRRLVGEGRLHRHPGPSKWSVRYDEAEVRKLAQTYKPRKVRRRGSPKTESMTGRTAAAVFACFARGATLQAIVLECRVTPGIVRRLWVEWQLGLEAGERAARAKVEAREIEKARREAERAMHRELRDRDRRRHEIEVARAGALGRVGVGSAGGQRPAPPAGELDRAQDDAPGGATR